MAETSAHSSTSKTSQTGLLPAKASSILPVLDFLDVSQILRRKSNNDSSTPSPTEAASLPFPLVSSASWVLLKQQNKNDELRKWFDLPQGVALMDDFNCALRKRILLQGRMYVFESYICFYCSLFGFVKKKVLPLPEVVAVRKKTHLRLPNSIEIEMVNGSKEFFTSFFSREDAFRIIDVTWHEAMLASTADGSGGDDAAAVGDGGSAGGRASSRRMRATERTASGEVATADAGSPEPGSEAPRRIRTGSSAKPLSRSDPSQQPCSNGTQAEAGTSGKGKERQADGAGSRPYQLEDDDEDDLNESEEDDSTWLSSAAIAPVPPLQSDHTLMVTATLPGSVREAFAQIWGNNSHLLEDVMEARGNRRINISSWRTHEQLGHVRDMQFVSPIPGAFASTWGTTHTKCYQSQRFVLCEGDHVVVETSQTMSEIPYGDHFTVDSRWDLKPNTTPDTTEPVTVVVHVRVPFHKRCMFKRMIESSSKKQYQEAATDMLAAARQALWQAGHAADAGGAGADDVPDSPSLSGTFAGRTVRRSVSQPHNLDGGFSGGLGAGSAAAAAARHARSQSQVSDMSLHLGALQKGVSLGAEGGEGSSRSSAVLGLLRALVLLVINGARRVGGVLGHWADVLVGNSHASPKMAALIILMVLMLAVQSACCLMWLLGNHWRSGIAHSSSAYSSSATMAAPVQRPLLQGNANSCGGGSASGGGLQGVVAEYWPARLEQLHGEVVLLQRRLEQVAAEVALAARMVAAGVAAQQGDGGGR